MAATRRAIRCWPRRAGSSASTSPARAARSTCRWRPPARRSSARSGRRSPRCRTARPSAIASSRSASAARRRPRGGRRDRPQSVVDRRALPPDRRRRRHADRIRRRARPQARAARAGGDGRRRRAPARRSCGAERPGRIAAGRLTRAGPPGGPRAVAPIPTVHFPPMRIAADVRTVIVLALTGLLLGGCASRPVNPKLDVADRSAGYRAEGRAIRGEASDTMVVLAFSGGGTRAAAFSFGVLEELRRTRGRRRRASAPACSTRSTSSPACRAAASPRSPTRCTARSCSTSTSSGS